MLTLLPHAYTQVPGVINEYISSSMSLVSLYVFK